MTFRTTVELFGTTATGLRVRATINGHTYRSTVAVHSDEFFLPLNA